LGGNPGRVQLNRLCGQNVAEPVFTDQHDQCRRGADNGLSPQSSDLALDGAFQADECGEPERGEKLDEVSAACAVPPNSGSASQICIFVKPS
jgi:hypothetical protein